MNSPTNSENGGRLQSFEKTYVLYVAMAEKPVEFYLAGEITQVIDSIPWVRCASGNVS